MMATLTIDGKQIQAREGTALLDAMTSAGIHVPTLCSHPDLEKSGECRLCSVELSRNGRSWVTASCTSVIEDGTIVRTDSPRVLATRKMMAELMLARTPNVPAVQRLAASVGVDLTRFETSSPDEVCTLCGRCIRACHEIAGKDVLGFVDRGGDRRVTMAFDTYDAAVCDDCNTCIAYCPTGAITQLENLPIGRRWYEHARGWIRKRQAVQYGMLALFAFFLFTTSQKWWGTFNIVNLFSRLDPLQAIAASIASRQFIFLYLPALLTIAATLAFGRVWCGWACPLGAVLDLFGPSGTRKMKPWFRQIKYGILFTILLMAAFGSLAFMFFDPITVLIRGVADPIRVAMSTMASPGVRLVTLVAMVPLLAVLWLNRIEKRFWCRYLCPLGAMVGVGSKFAWIRRRVDEAKCVKCGTCAATCTMGAINPDTIKNDPAECVMCLDCAAPCPMTAITYERQTLSAFKTLEYNPERRGFIGSAATSAAGLVLFNTGIARAQSADLLRPPGVAAKEQAFLAECIRCGQCVEACPGNALHPVPFGMSWDSLWTPALMPPLGGCQWDCNRCGQVCPSGAIPNLALEEKRKQAIGIAVVDEELCINCMVCEKACPAKAIGRVEIRKGGNRKPLPVVASEKCNGCGQCEYMCPARPSITVYQVGKAPKMRELERI